MVGRKNRQQKLRKAVERNGLTSSASLNNSFSSDVVDIQDESRPISTSSQISNTKASQRVQFANDRVNDVANSRVHRVRGNYPKRKNASTKVLLLRRHREIGFGFSIRGGVEHGTGIFVSKINRYSDAYAQGLQVGDQILRANNALFEGILHDEAAQVSRPIKNRNF